VVVEIPFPHHRFGADQWRCEGTLYGDGAPAPARSTLVTSSGAYVSDRPYVGEQFEVFHQVDDEATVYPDADRLNELTRLYLSLLPRVLLFVGGAIWLDRFDRTADQAGALAAGVLLALAAGGAAGVALLAESVSLGLLAASVAASALAYVIWRLAALVLIGNPGRFGATALYGGAGALLVVVALMAVQVARIFGHLHLDPAFAYSFCGQSIRWTNRRERFRGQCIFI